MRDDDPQPLVPDATQPPRRRYKLTIAYDGTLFHGWQKQLPPDGEPLRTVAGEIEQTLQRVMQQPIMLLGASRTDAGVHATGQVAHFDAATRIPIERMTQAINSRLCDEIEILTAEVVPDEFDAISDAVRKQYCYRLFNTEHRPLHLRNCVYHCWTPLDIARMNDAARRLVGTHDFEGFASVHHGRTTTVRTIFDCAVTRVDSEVRITVVGNGFLYNMVRIIAGTLVEVGRGRLEPDVIDKVLASCNRRDAGPTLPPQGLWLQWIEYRQLPVSQPSPAVSDESSEIQ